MDNFTRIAIHIKNRICNVYKVLSLILIFSILLLTFNFVSSVCLASNSTEDNANNANDSNSDSSVIEHSDSTLQQFSDIPAEHWAFSYVHKLRDLEITNGVGSNKFGLGTPISKGEFVTFLVRLMDWELLNPDVGSFNDNIDKSKWYYQYIETALVNNAILKDTDAFRPEDLITREEMALMIVRSLGYNNLAQQISKLQSSFTDVERNLGYITIAKDLGIIQGIAQGNGEFMFLPYNNAFKEEAAAMMIRMFEKLNNPLKELHAFYAIKSYQQKDFIKDLSSVSFGWSRLEYDNDSGQIILNTSVKNNNEFYIPSGYSDPLSIAKQSNIPTQLMVFLKNNIINASENIDTVNNNETTNEVGNNKDSITTATYILTNKEVRSNVISMISTALQGSADVQFDGVVIDFENMFGNTLRNAFNEFLSELKAELEIYQKSLSVAVHPKRAPGQDYFDGYDYKTIGDIADKIVLMAHDYNSKQLTEAEMDTGYNITPLTPIDEVYFALKAITDKKDGVSDPSKILLQISFDSAQWKLKEGKVINPLPLRPDYEAITQRLLKDDTKLFYSNIDENPYAKFIDPSDGTSNIIWYEDSRSVAWKLKLAQLFGVGGISIWRLGNIPNFEERVYMDIWDIVTDLMSKSEQLE